MSRVTDRNDWFEMWFTDKNAMIETMLRNMNSDLEAGYDLHGVAIVSQQYLIDMYKDHFDHEVEMLKNMTEEETNHWCYLDMKRRGVID